MYTFSQLPPNALKAKKKYTTAETNWVCYWHLLSGGELKLQIITVAYKPKDMVYSFNYPELADFYKLDEVQGIKKQLEKVFDVNDVDEPAKAIIQFLDDAKIEYSGKTFIQKDIKEEETHD
jgi:hypothetical protein